eukprot:1219946-Rhodomonas_salina.4
MGSLVADLALEFKSFQVHAPAPCLPKANAKTHQLRVVPLTATPVVACIPPDHFLLSRPCIAASPSFLHLHPALTPGTVLPGTGVSEILCAGPCWPRGCPVPGPIPAAAFSMRCPLLTCGVGPNRAVSRWSSRGRRSLSATTLSPRRSLVRARPPPPPTQPVARSPYFRSGWAEYEGSVVMRKDVGPQVGDHSLHDDCWIAVYGQVSLHLR